MLLISVICGLSSVVSSACCGINKFDILCKDFGNIVSLAVVVIVCSCLDTTHDSDPLTACEVFADEFCRLTPSNAIDEICLLVSVVVLELTVNSNRKIAYLDLTRCCFNFGILC